MARTALNLTDEEIKSYSLLKNIPKWQAEERRKKALEIARSIANLLRDRFGATRVVAFGSITCSDRFTPWSDIDIAVYGLKTELFYKAVSASFDIAKDFYVDIIDPYECPMSLLEDIELNGIEL